MPSSQLTTVDVEWRDKGLSLKLSDRRIDLYICSFCGIKGSFEIVLESAYACIFLTLINVFVPHFKIP